MTKMLFLRAREDHYIVYIGFSELSLTAQDSIDYPLNVGRWVFVAHYRADKGLLTSMICNS